MALADVNVLADCTWMARLSPAKMAEVAQRTYLQLQAVLPAELRFTCVHDWETAAAFGLRHEQRVLLRSWTGHIEVEHSCC